ncbi:MAG: citrate/2-methylcitrate synthase [Planctomycetota bacterium]
MAETNSAPKAGLEGVTAADSGICLIDGSVGELRYRGYLIKELAEFSDFAETSMLLLDGELPQKAQLDAFRQTLAEQRALAPEVIDLVRLFAPKMTPMDCLRTVVSALAMVDVPQNGDTIDQHRARGIRLIAQTPTILAAYARIRDGKDPIDPDPSLDLAADFLRMLNGTRSAEDVEQMFDVCLILHAEHGFNASTFSGRVTAATLSDVYSAVTSAIGTLKGPLHGGANTAVMEMLIQIGEAAKVEEALDGMLARKEKIMGFGHRVYKVVDPRALILKDFSQRLAEGDGDAKWFEMSQALESAMKEKKGIDMNVDFYSASTYYNMGIAPDLFTGIFAISRMSGWVAHILEQLSNNRLIRPRANYIGSSARDFVQLGDR